VKRGRGVARSSLDGLLVKRSPVRDATSHVANVEEVEHILLECPLFVNVVNLEFAVGWHK